MKKYLFLAILSIIPAFYSNTFAQTYEPVYLETDRLFRNVAVLSSGSATNKEIENFGRSIELRIERDLDETRYADEIRLLKKDPSEVRGKIAATYLIEIQRSYSFVRANSLRQDTPKVRNSLEAGALIIEYMNALLKPSLSFPDDPLKRYIREIQTAEGINSLRKDLDQRLGDGVVREENAALLFKEMSIGYKTDNIEQVRSNVYNNAAAALPYPLCLITKRCPTR